MLYTMNQPKLETNRLILRKFERSDSSEVERLAGDKAVALMTLNVPHPYLPGMALEWISTHDQGWKDRSNITYGIMFGDSAQLVGAMGLVLNSREEAELGYWIGKDYWGNGYCTEAAEKLLDFGFRKLGLERVIARHLANNPASGRVMEKCGMVFCGTSEGGDRNGELTSFVHYVLSRT